MSGDLSRIVEYLEQQAVQAHLGLSSSEVGELSAKVFIAATGYEALCERAKCLDQMSRIRQMERYGVSLPSAAVEHRLEGWTDLEIRRQRNETHGKLIGSERHFSELSDVYFGEAVRRLREEGAVPEPLFSRSGLDTAAVNVGVARSSLLLSQLSEFELAFNDYSDTERIGRAGARAVVAKIYYLNARDCFGAFRNFSGEVKQKLSEGAQKPFDMYGRQLQGRYRQTKEHLVTAQEIYKQQAVERYGNVERVLSIPTLWFLPQQVEDINAYVERQDDPGLKKSYNRLLERSELYSSPEQSLLGGPLNGGEARVAIMGREESGARGR